MPNSKSYQICKRMIHNVEQCTMYELWGVHRITCYNYICVCSSKLCQFHQMQIAGSRYPSELDSGYFYGLLEELQHDPEQLEALLKGDRYLPGTKNDSVCVLTGVDRGKNLVIKPVCLGKLESGHVCQEFDTRFGTDAMIVTDGNSSYNWFAEERNIHHEVIPADKHAVGPYSLARVNAIHADYNKYYPQHKQNLPATKYLDLGTDFFWWSEKNKDNSIEEKVDMLYKMVQEDNYTESYEDMKHRKLKLDTKGLIPTEL